MDIVKNRRSFDVWDTLIARRYINSDMVLDIVSDGRVDFLTARKAADNGARSLLQIYQMLEADGIIPKGTAAQHVANEVAAEERLVFPIKETMNLVRDGDILVSDMYMSAPDILRLVRSCGLNKQVTIYQSNSDKRSGKFWAGAKDLNLEVHIGDNIHSDVEIPRSFGINSNHYPKTSIVSQVEQKLIDKGLTQMSLLLREIRLRNHEPENNHFWICAHQLNLPWLFMACEILKRRFKGQPITFLGRDCQLIHKIYARYFNEHAYYLPFSRHVALNQTEQAVAYLNAMMGQGSVLVDISSTGRTWEKVAEVQDIPVHVLIYSDKYHYSKHVPVPPPGFTWSTKNSEVGQTNELLEVLNCGDHGRLVKLETVNGVPLAEFASHDLSPEVIRLAHKPVLDAVDLYQHYSDIYIELMKLSEEDLLELFKTLMMSICLNKALNEALTIKTVENGIGDEVLDS